MLKKAVLLVSGNAFGSALLLVRNLLVARMVSPEDYGIASTFAISMSIVEMVSYLGLQQLIVVDKDGDEPGFQAAMQGFQVLRGFLSSALLFLIAYPYARFLSIENVAWAFQVIALIPLINGLQHYDMHRLKRQMKFTPSIVSTSVPALVSVLSLWPLAAQFDDYRIMLVAIFVQAGAMVLLSHLLSERRYRLTLDFGLMRKAMQFGWPLLLNGMLLFLVFNGEKLVVGRELGMSALAIFSMGFTLTLTPTLVLASSIQSFFLPQLSSAQDRPADFQHTSITTLEASLVTGVLLVLGTSLLGGPVVILLLSDKYLEMLPILVPLAVLQAIRSAKTGSSIVALAKQRAGNAIVGNIPRVISIPITWWVAIRTGDLAMMIWIATIAEIVGYFASLYMAQRTSRIDLRPLIVPILTTSAAFVTALVDSYLYLPGVELKDHLHVTHGLVVVISIAALFSMRNLTGYVMTRLRRRG
jgi:O-antigen/teichoic acid export membrane protein